MNSKMKRYFKRTWKNKVVSLALIGIGAACTAIDGDGTFLCLPFLVLLFLEIGLDEAKESRRNLRLLVSSQILQSVL